MIFIVLEVNLPPYTSAGQLNFYYWRQQVRVYEKILRKKRKEGKGRKEKEGEGRKRKGEGRRRKEKETKGRRRKKREGEENGRSMKNHGGSRVFVFMLLV